MKKIITTLPLLLPVLLLPACSGKHKSAATDAEALQKVTVATVETDSVLLHKDYPAYLTAINTTTVVGRANGEILSKNYEGGGRVVEGQVLFTIEPTKYRDALKQAQAQLQDAQSQYEYASQHYAALKKALESDAVSKMEVMQGESAVEQAEAAVKSAEAAISEARVNLSYCTVRAPHDGLVTTNTIGVGSYCAGEANPVVLCTIYDDSKVEATFTVDDASYLKIIANENKDDMPDLNHVPITFSEKLPHTYTGSISYFAPDINTSTGSMQMKCVIDNPYRELKTGMYVTVSLPTYNVPDAILVKDASLGTDQRGRYLYTVTDSNTVAYTPVEVGEMANDSMRIVTSGLERNSRYVTEAMLKVRDGMKIDPIATR